MTNIQKLIAGTKNQRLFANTVIAFARSQGFYGRLLATTNELDDEGFTELCDMLEKQDFKDAVDVVLWLEG